MVAAFPQPFVPGPARIPVKYGLFSVLDFRGSADAHWSGAGVRFQDFDGSEDLGVVGFQPASGDPLGIPREFESSVDVDEAGVFSVYGQQVITPAGGWTQEKASARAEDFLIALEERTVEKVMSGQIAAGFSPNLTAATSIGSTDRVIHAVAALEEYLSDHYGSLGVLHLSRADALIGLSLDACLMVQGGGIYTKLGTPVAAGQGYPDGTAWCTSQLIAYRSEIDTLSGRSYDLLDKGENDLYAVAQRTYTIGWESAALAAITIGDSPT
jgi:hypothetical protein